MSNNYQMEYYVRSKDINNKLGLSVSSASPYFLNAIKDNEEFKNVEIKDIHITHNNPSELLKFSFQKIKRYSSPIRLNIETFQR